MSELQQTSKMTMADICRLAEAKAEEERQQFGADQSPGSAGVFTFEELKKALESGEDGDAWLFVQIHRGAWVFDHAAGRWYRWAGHYWREDSCNEILAAFDPLIDEYSRGATQAAWQRNKATRDGNQEAADAAASLEKRFLKRVNELQTLRRKKNILILAAAGERGLSMSGHEWDAKPWLLGCVNGVLELRGELKFRPGQQNDWVKTPCPTEWRGIDAPAPTFYSFLNSTFDNDAALIGFIQRLFGHAVTRTCQEHTYTIAHGQGRNGKDTLLQEAIGKTFGDLAGPVQSELLLDQGRARSSSAPTSDIMALRGKLIVWASETDRGRKLSIGRIKQLSGGNKLVGRELYGRHEITFSPTHTLFLLTNHKPKADPEDYALWKRIHLIPFTKSFVDNPTEPHERKRDPLLAEKLKAETPGILAWVVAGCFQWQKQGLDPPPAVLQATKEYQQQEDIVGQFVDNVCVRYPHTMVKAGELRKAYEAWSEENGYRPVSGNQFASYLLKHFDRDDSGRHRVYLGLGLKVDQNGK